MRGLARGICLCSRGREVRGCGGRGGGGRRSCGWGKGGVSGGGDGGDWRLVRGGGKIHVGEFGGNDEPVVAYEGFSCCADTLFAVGC